MTTHLRTDRMLYLDMELTCWGDEHTDMQPEIIQIGICEQDVVKGAILRRQGWYVRPRISTISAYCTQLTGITPEIIRREGRPLGECLSSLQKMFSLNSKMVCAWGDDVPELVAAARKDGIELTMHGVNIGFLWTCTTGAARSVGLHAALRQLGMEFEGTPHDAVVDAVNTARMHAEWLRRSRAAILGRG